MLKKIMFTALALVIVLSTVILGYRLFEPNTEDSTKETYLPYDSLTNYIISNGDASVHYLFFFSSESDDCKYVKTTIITKTAKDTGLDLSSIIETVNITEIDKDGDLQKLHTEWGISAYPAFLAVSVKDGSPVIDNELEWNAEHPITEDDLKQWLSLNDLYHTSNE